MPANGSAATATALPDSGVYESTFCPGNIAVYNDWTTSDLWSLNLDTNAKPQQLTQNSGFEPYCR